MDNGTHFYDLANAAPVLIWRADDKRQLNWANQCWFEFTGQMPADLPGASWANLIHPDDLQNTSAELEAAYAACTTLSREFRMLRHDGQYRWVVDNARPLFLSDGSFRGYVGSCVDITERKEAEMRARSALEDATRALKQRDVLLAEVHHRVKNNLQVILSLLGLHGRTVSIDVVRHELEAIASRIRALAIVQQELHEDADVSRIDIHQYISRLAGPLAQLHSCEHIEVRVSGVARFVEIGKAGVVGLILAELLSNCFGHAFSDGKGHVDIDISAAADGASQVHIRDSGPGFSEGTPAPHGIGLRLVESLARQVGIAITRNPREGALATLLIPAPAPDDANKPALAPVTPKLVWSTT